MNSISAPPPYPTGSNVSFFSSIQGPTISASTWEWQLRYTLTTVGTVFVTVDQETNQTETSTSFHTEHQHFATTGSFSNGIFTRTDTDAAGTVTSAFFHGGSSVTVTYPTNWVDLPSSFTWDAIIPTFVSNASCCLPTKTFSPTPSHTPVPVTTASTLSDDPKGLLYALYFAGGIDTQVSDFWGPQTYDLTYDGCPYTMCHISRSPSISAYPSATYQKPQAYLLATSTTTLSSIGLNGGGGDGPTSTPPTTPEPDNQGPGPTSTAPVISPEPDQQGPGPSNNPPPSDQNSNGGSPPPDTTPAPNPGNDNPSQGPGNGQPGNGQPGNEQPGNGGPNGQQMPPNVAPAMTIGSSVVTPNSASQYIVGDQTLAPGSAIEVSGTTYSLPTGGSQLVVGTQTSDLTPGMTGPPGSPSGGSLPTLTFEGSAVTPNSASEYVVGGQTLAPGSEVVVSGTTISLASGGSSLVVGTETGSSPTTSMGSGDSSGSSGSGAGPSTSQTDTANSGASRTTGISCGIISASLAALLMLI